MYFTGNQNNYDKFRYLINEASKINKDKLVPFLIPPEEAKDDIIVNLKFEQYIEKIKEDTFYSGNIEISTSTILFDINVTIYKLLNENDDEYTFYTNIWKEEFNKNKKYILLLFEGNNHFSLLTYKEKIIKTLII